MTSIYLYSPSGALRDRNAARRAIRRLQQHGYDVREDPDLYTHWQRFAGDDATRLAAIRRAAASGADIAMISRGGYGLGRLLPQMPWDDLALAARNGTRFIGFSDFTVFQLGLLAQTGAVTWAGPALCEGFGRPQAHREEGKATRPPAIDETTWACFEDVASGISEGTGWRLRQAERALLPPGEEIQLAHDATLWGGNLTMVASLLGTPWWPDTRGGVLFLEDVGEHPYRVERTLSQLLYAGVLKQQVAILLGDFTDYRLTGHDAGFNLKHVVEWLRANAGVPILTGLPFGHVARKVLLPVGAPIDLMISHRDVFLLWGHKH